MCDHSTREGGRFIGGDPGHDFYRCQDCGDTYSVVVE